MSISASIRRAILAQAPTREGQDGMSNANKANLFRGFLSGHAFETKKGDCNMKSIRILIILNMDVLKII
jgi:hypothetical protein